MEHITVTELEDGNVKLVPDEGYRLYHKILRRYFSEAICQRKDMTNFKAVVHNGD